MNSYSESDIKITNSSNPREVFMDVCTAIGNHFSAQGFVFFKSRPKIVRKTESLTTEIAFSSSHSNSADGYVCLEVIGSVFSSKLAKFQKAHEGEGSGYLLGHADFWDQQRFLEKSQRVNCNFNVHGLTREGFSDIIEFIDRVFIEQVRGLESVEGMIEFINNCDRLRKPHRDLGTLQAFIERQYNGDSKLLDALASLRTHS